MFIQSAKNALIIAVAIGSSVFMVGCYRTYTDPTRLNIRLTGADSPKDAESMIRASLAKKYSGSGVDIAEGYTTYYVTNGPDRWMFVQAANAPRGLNMFNLYCYEQRRADAWVLRAYVPVNAHDYTNGVGRQLEIHTDGEYVKVDFRGESIFTGSTKNQSR